MKGVITGKVVEWENGEKMEKLSESFSFWDFTTFGLLLVVSTIIGIYFGWKDRKNKDDNNYALGGQKFTAFPVALSLTATSLSAITMMGSPSEYYSYGSSYAWVIVADIIACLFAAFIYLPIYYNLGVTSIYEYVDMRFGRTSRVIMTAIFLTQSILYNGLVVYAPALAMNQVAGLDINIAILLVGIVCMVYTSLGGMKAVIWTDVYQSVWMFSGFAILVIVASFDFEGFGNVLKAVQRGHRGTPQFEIDPRYRHTFWTVLIGNCTGAEMATFVCQQYKVQRYLSCKSLKEAQKCIFYAIPVTATITAMSLLAGYCAYAYFEHCDPYTSQWIGARDQILPYLSLYMFATVAPGLAGVYMSAVFGATLSTTSSSINSCSVVLIEDIIKPIGKLKNNSIPWLSKMLMMSIGVLIIGFAYMSKYFEGILEACQTINGLVGGSMVGFFTIGVFIPWISEVPAIVGLSAGLFSSVFIFTNSKFDPPGPEWTRPLNLNRDGCAQNETWELFKASSSMIMFRDYERPDTEFQAAEQDFNIFHISYSYLGTFGMLTTIIVSCLVASIINKYQTGHFFESWQKPSIGTTWQTRLDTKRPLLEDDFKLNEIEKLNDYIE